jgi:CubicO group peptidase (beta-lactamase class C family)
MGPESYAHISSRHLSGSRLDALIHLSESPACDALQVRINGESVFTWTTERGRRPIDLMSATKSVTSLIVGRLVTQGLLNTIDRPASDYLPSWRDTQKEQITIRHLLEHTSGLACRRTTEEIYASSDFVRYALDAEVVSEPGVTFTYNNRAVNLLAEVVRQASGSRIDDYAAAELFGPLGIEEWQWTVDGSGNPHCMAGLRLSAEDFATIGQLMAQNGVWNGEQLLSPEWVRASVTPSVVNASYGLLWWLIGHYLVVLDDKVINLWRAAEPPVPETFIAQLAPLRDRPLERDEFLAEMRELVGDQEWDKRTWRSGLPDGRRIMTHVNGFYASGSGGQFLVVLPDEGTVASRLWAMESPFEDVHRLVELLRGLHRAAENR